MTRAELIARAARRLARAPLSYGHGTDNPRDEAAWLVLRGLGLPFDAPLDRVVPASGIAKVEALVQRRVAGRIPTAYLLQEAWLDGVPFHVDERVIVPRSHIAALLRDPLLGKRSYERILDLCTGSGCLAILAARAFPSARVDAADISPEALAVARRNVARHRLGRRVRLVQSDVFSALRGERYDLIVTNPPYVSARAMAALPAEYRHEPPVALAGGSDGLDLVERILREAPAHLAADGLLVCEVGDGRARARRRFASLALSWPAPEIFLYRPARSAAAARRNATRAAGAG